MTTTNTDIIIIGAGLTGLTLAYYLSKTDYNFVILEARDRIGGRILTKENEKTTSIELGATWFANQHTEVLNLLDQLGLKLFDQVLGNTAIYEPVSTNPAQIVELPKNQTPSYRLKGGTSKLTEALSGFINPEYILLNQAVKSISRAKNKTIVTTHQNSQFTANYVVSTLPPHLLNNTVSVTPKLENSFCEVAQKTHTWMGESIKVGLTYKEAFWQKDNLSGTIFSNVGPIPEMYDHSNKQNNQFALKGFLNGNFFKISKQERLEAILNQLEKYYGSQARAYLSYEETIWKLEKYTSTDYDDIILPHQNNGDAVFHQTYLENSLFIAGTETSSQFSGYMEGAVRSAQYVFNQLTKKRL
ncbi:flavin monoamine oxidase family protein [Wenyingzhuangia sp. IMCC45533]